MSAPMDQELERQLRDSLGRPPQADFDHWRERHGEAVAYLNPVVTEIRRRRRRIVVRVASATVAAALILITATLLLVPEQTSFAQTVKTIDEAKSITWTSTTYMRATSLDGKRTWLNKSRRSNAYRYPGHYRTVDYDDDGNISLVCIIDTRMDKSLMLNMKTKKALWTTHPPLHVSDPENRGPFCGIADSLKNKPLELVGQRDVDGKTANVFRFVQKGDGSSFDVWIDTESKKLVGYSSPGADVFDPRTMPDRDSPAEAKYSGKLLGAIDDQIVFDAELDATLFDMTPPEGFEVEEEKLVPVTEKDVVEWLGVTARFNGGTFSDTSSGFDSARFHEAETKAKTDRTDTEQKMIDMFYRHAVNHNSDVMRSFQQEFAVDGTFRYLGKGVKLGDKDRIVCWYKLKSTGQYRAVYGDLTIRDVTPEDLPLPVEDQTWFADTVKAIDEAKSITWTSTTYMRATSLDGKRTWLKKSRRINAYRYPGHYRTVDYDDDGNISLVCIIDTKKDKSLMLNMKTKKALWTTQTTLQVYDPEDRGPFCGIADILKNKPLEFVGQRDVNGTTVNVFRRGGGDKGNSSDIWIDAKSKQLVGYSSPVADDFDPWAMPDRDNPPEAKYSGELLGGISDEIDFNAELDATLFEMTPPEGFEIEQEKLVPVTEEDVVEWLGATARCNAGVFSDTSNGCDIPRWNEIVEKEKADRTDAERTMVDIYERHLRNNNGAVLWYFQNEFAVDGTFRYIGKGVKLGDKDRIVCWYKLKSTGQYRAVYGDLTIRDVTPDDLPLPVEE